MRRVFKVPTNALNTRLTSYERAKFLKNRVNSTIYSKAVKNPVQGNH